MTMILAAALLLAVIPHDGATVDRTCDVETNHFHDSDGRLVFTQVIWRCWNARKSRYDIVDWRLLRPGMQPVYDYERREYRCHWFDGERERLVIAKTARETWTQHDVELTSREDLPTDTRETTTALSTCPWIGRATKSNTAPQGQACKLARRDSHLRSRV